MEQDEFTNGKFVTLHFSLYYNSYTIFSFKNAFTESKVIDLLLKNVKKEVRNDYKYILLRD